MVRVVSVGLAVFAAHTSADVYRWVGPEGQTYYSDHAPHDSQRIDIQDGVVSTDQQPRISGSPEGPLLGSYKRLEIVFPRADQAIILDANTIPVSLILEPALKVGHRLEFFVDGNPIGFTKRSAAHMLLHGLSPGAHETEARIMDPAGIVARSAPVKFYVRTARPPGVIP